MDDHSDAGEGANGHALPPRGVNDHSPSAGGAERSFTAALGVLWPKTITVTGTPDQRMAWIADRQRGNVSREQLLAIGISSSTVDRSLKRGPLHRRHPGVYVYGHRAPVPLAEETAAILALRDGAVLSHHTAAAMWGLMPAGERQVHALVLGHARAGRLDGVVVHRTAVLEPGDIRTCKGLPVTSPLRTVLDMAWVLSGRPLELMLDHAIVDHHLDTELLGRRCKGRPGGPRLVAILDRWNGPTITRSKAEELFLRLIRQAELPPPRINIRNDGKERDYRWPAQRILVEIDGYLFHGTHRAFDQDRRRDAQASALGFTTIRITYRQLIDEPMAVIARLSAALVHGETRSRGPSEGSSRAGSEGS
jgi:very-short-patch-repair endonuclease